MLCLPAALVCIAPVRGPNGLLRASTRGYLLAATGVVALVSFLGAALCASLNLPCNLIIGAVMPLFFLLYRHYVDLGWLRALFVFLLAAAAMAFCAVLTDVLLARLEVGNHSGVPSWPSATVQFALGLLTALMLCPILSRKLAWLLRAPGRLLEAGVDLSAGVSAALHADRAAGLFHHTGPIACKSSAWCCCSS